MPVAKVNFWQDKTQDIINQYSWSKKPSWARTQSQFIDDIKKVMSTWNYTDNNDAIRDVLSYAQSKGVSYEWVDTESLLNQTVKKKEDISLFQRFWETFKKRWEAQKEIMQRWVAWETTAVEWWLLAWANFLWTIADLTWDVIAEWFTELDQFWDEWSMQRALESWIQQIAETNWWEFAFSKLAQASKNLEDLKKLDPVKWARFQWGLDLINWALELAWLSATTKWVKTGFIWAKKWANQAYQKWIQLWEDIVKKTKTLKDNLPNFRKTTEDKILRETWLQTQKGLIWGKEVEIPVQKTWILEKVTKPWQTTDTKILAWRALSPRVTWKWRKWRLSAVADAETNLKKFYENVRTWVLKGNIDTIENAAQTAIDSLDVVWERIGKAIEKVEWILTFDKTILNDMKMALTSKWAKQSPATSIIWNMIDDIWDGKLNFADAFELKKIYANEVSKLYKAWDAWTKQYKVLSEWVDFLNKKIEHIITTWLWDTFKEDKAIYASLMKIVDDLVHSAMVEWRRAPNTLAEQIWFIEWLFSPVWTLKQWLIKEIGKWSTRGWAFQELIKQYDLKAVNSAKRATENAVVVQKVLAEIKDIPVTNKVKLTNKILEWVTVAEWRLAQAKKMIKDFIQKNWEAFKAKLWELFDDLADKLWARSKFMQDTGKSLDDFWWATDLVKEAKKYKTFDEFIKEVKKWDEYLSKKFFMKNILDDRINLEQKFKDAQNRLRSAKAQIGKDKAKIEWRWTIRGMNVNVTDKTPFLERIKQNEKIVETWEKTLEYLDLKKIYKQANKSFNKVWTTKSAGLIEEAKKYKSAEDIKTLPTKDFVWMEDIDDLEQLLRWKFNKQELDLWWTTKWKTIEDWAKWFDFKEPVDVSISKEWDFTISDWHHRALAWRILDREIPVIVKSRLQWDLLWKYISLIKKWYKRNQIYKSWNEWTFEEQVNNFFDKIKASK